ncbi:MAG: DUF4342 domain-containing protein [Clostridia bacterium]
MSEQSNQEYNQGNQTNQGNPQRSGVFSFLYRTRVRIDKGNTSIVNLSLLFALLAAISAPWVAVVGGIVALVLGYRFSIERNADEFASDFQDVVKDAAGNVKSAVDSVVGEKKA